MPQALTFTMTSSCLGSRTGISSTLSPCGASRIAAHIEPFLRPPLDHHLTLRVELDPVAPGGVQIPEERVLPAGEREEGDRRGHAYVHPDHAALDLPPELPRSTAVAREDGRRVAVAGVVYSTYGLVQIFHALDGENGAEDLLLRYLHLGCHPIK